MDALMAADSIGGGAVAGAASEKLLEKEMKENSTSECCASLSMKTRFIVFGICYVLGKLNSNFSLTVC